MLSSSAPETPSSPDAKQSMLRSWLAESVSSSYEDLPDTHDAPYLLHSTSSTTGTTAAKNSQANPSHKIHPLHLLHSESWLEAGEEESALTAMLMHLYDQLLSLMATKQYAEALSVCQQIRNLEPGKNILLNTYEMVVQQHLDAAAAGEEEESDQEFSLENCEQDDEEEEEEEE